MKFQITESPNSYLLLELNKDEKIIIEIELGKGSQFSFTLQKWEQLDS